MDKRLHSLRQINFEQLIPTKKVDYLEQMIANEISHKKDIIRYVLIALFVAVFILLLNNWFAGILGYILFSWLNKRYFSDAFYEAILAYMPSFFRDGATLRDYRSKKELLLQDAKAVQFELESRPNGFLFRFADYLEDRRFRCETISDELLWHYMSLSHNQRGGEIPLKAYQHIIKSLDDCIELPDTDVEKKVLIDSAKLLSEIDDTHNMIKLQDLARVMLKEWSFSSKVQPRHEILFASVDEVEEALRYIVGWYGRAAENLLDRVTEYKRTLVAQGPELVSVRKELETALEAFTETGVPDDSPLKDERL